MTFLTKHYFDWNRLFHFGIHSVSEAERAALITEMEEERLMAQGGLLDKRFDPKSKDAIVYCNSRA